VLSLQKPPPPALPVTKTSTGTASLRVKQPSPMTIGECAISNDGTRIAFRASQDGQNDYGSPAATAGR